jgi:hypothetical protein
MWSQRSIILVVAAMLVVVAVGCAEKDYPSPRRVANEASGARAATVDSFFDPMITNAAAYDLSLADFHFVPHTVHLNPHGEQRLDQLTTVLQSYGGVIRYETFRTDEEFVDGRLEAVRTYVLARGCDPEKVEVQSMLSGGRGRSAEEAIAATKATSKKEQRTDAFNPGELLGGGGSE